VLSESCQRLLAVGRRVHLIAILSKGVADHAADGWVIIDDQDASHSPTQTQPACHTHAEAMLVSGARSRSTLAIRPLGAWNALIWAISLSLAPAPPRLGQAQPHRAEYRSVPCRAVRDPSQAATVGRSTDSTRRHKSRMCIRIVSATPPHGPAPTTNNPEELRHVTLKVTVWENPNSPDLADEWWDTPE
jgi:hypothetical protein